MRTLIAALVLATSSTGALAQGAADYPSKPIRFISISAAGSGGDVLVRLLADKEGVVCAAYGIMVDKEVDGVMRSTVNRSTFVIDRDGVLRREWRGVKVAGHAQDVLSFVTRL